MDAPRLTLEEVYTQSEEWIQATLQANSQPSRDFLTDRMVATILAHNAKMIDKSDELYIKHPQFNNIYVVPDDQIIPYVSNTIEVSNDMNRFDIIRLYLTFTPNDNQAISPTRSSSISSDDFGEASASPRVSAEFVLGEEEAPLRESSVSPLEIQAIVNKYITKPVTVFINSMPDDKYIVYFNVSNLDPNFVKALQININKNLAVHINNLGRQFEVTTIENSGVLHFPLSQIYHAQLSEMVNNMIQWIFHPGARCPSCHKQHQTETILPMVCNADFCTFSTKEFGFTVDVWDQFKNNIQTVDLLWSLFYTAINDGRRDDVSDPFPEKFIVGGHRDYDAVLNILISMPKFTDIKIHMGQIEMSVDEEASRKTIFYDYLTTYNSDIPYIVKWLFGSMRNPITYINDTSDRNKFGDCSFAFHILTATPERAANFKALKQQYGIKEGYHGSPTANWHSILRYQLRNFSGTCRQAHGQVHGSGVYLAPNKYTARGYSNKGKITYHNSQFYNKRLYITAEFINRNVHTVNNFCYVIPNENDVNIKYLCIF